jgi:hypothetical protein
VRASFMKEKTKDTLIQVRSKPLVHALIITHAQNHFQAKHTFSDSLFLNTEEGTGAVRVKPK